MSKPSARWRPHDETVVSAEVEARVARLAADMGDRVAAGAPLVDPRRREAPLPRRRTARRARADAGAARRARRPSCRRRTDAGRAQRAGAADRSRTEARPRPAARRQEAAPGPGARTRRNPARDRPRRPFERRSPRRRNLRAEITAREAALKGASRDLQDAVIRAPFDGVVAERLVSPGQFVRVQTPVMRIVRLHPLRLTAEIPERFGPAIRVGHTLSPCASTPSPTVPSKDASRASARTSI